MDLQAKQTVVIMNQAVHFLSEQLERSMLTLTFLETCMIPKMGNISVSKQKIKSEDKLLWLLEGLIFLLRVLFQHLLQVLFQTTLTIRNLAIQEVEEVPLSKKTTVQMEITLLATMMGAVAKILNKMSISPNLQKNKSMKIMIFSILR